MHCKTMLNTLITGIALLCAPVLATAQDAWPSKTIRIIAPVQPGGGVDLVARLVADRLGKVLGQSIIVDNMSGGGGIVGSLAAARAAPDGYTLMVGYVGTHGTNPALRKLPYDAIKDFTPIAMIGGTPNIMVVNPKVPANNLKEFIAYAKANRGKVNTASTGRGTYTHLTIELFNSITGAELTHIPYKGAAPAMTDLVGRQIQAMFTTTTSAQPYTSTGRLKALGITAPRRSPMLADVPTFAEGGVANLNVSSWIGIAVPAGSPAPAVKRLSDAFGQALQAPVLRERLAVLGAEPAGDTAEKFTRMIRGDIERWAEIIKSAGITVE